MERDTNTPNHTRGISTVTGETYDPQCEPSQGTAARATCGNTVKPATTCAARQLLTADRQYQPRGLLLQWHVTERCNLSCTHCYQEDAVSDELPFDGLLDVLVQFRELLRFWRSRAPERRTGGHITLTGGEPFVRADFLTLLETLRQHRREFSFAVLTNGTLIDRALARALGKLRPSFVQVSIEGTAATHDAIRGHGSYQRAVEGLRQLRRCGIRTLIAFTAHRGNYREFPAVAELGRSLGVARVWADRLIPQGSGAALRQQVLTPEETREFLQVLRSERDKTRRRWLQRTEIACHRALQFLVAGGRPYRCTAGDSLLTVQPNGDLFPCRRLPIPVGNLREHRLIDLYYEAPLLRQLRDRQTVCNGCEECLFRRTCQGGLRCLSYAMTGAPFRADPGCWVQKM